MRNKLTIGFIFLLIITFCLIGCSDDSGSTEEDVALISTIWKTSITEEINNVEETYDVVLAFGNGVVNFYDTSSEPSNENGIYTVKGKSVTITISSMGIMNKSGSILGNELKIDLGMGLMTFTKQ